jgi:GT2 family glycosyltransferase
MVMFPPSLLVVIVNYRTPQLAIACLQSLVPEVQELSAVQVAVVDNHSEDGSLAAISEAIAQENWQDWVSIQASDRNGGFAYGNNQAIRPALASPHPPDYVLLLNPDTIVRPGALTALVEFLEDHPQVGIVGSRLEHPDGTPQHSAFRFHTLWSELDQGLALGLMTKVLSRWVIAPPISATACPTDWVSGASLMVRRSVFEAIGLLDEDYFMYFEEVDFCRRALQAGWSCWYVPQSRVVHLVGQSSGVKDPQRPTKRLPQYWFDSRQRFFLKHYGWHYTALTDALWLLGFSLWRVRRVLQRKPDLDPPQLLSDFLMNSVFRCRKRLT